MTTAHDDPILHPACAAYPVTSEIELEQLADDIRLNGLIEPITRMPDGSILDGRCRELACRRAGVEPRYETYTGDDPVRFVIAKNERRRHLSHAQRALIAATLANIDHGGYRQGQEKVKTFGKDLTLLTQPEAAKLMNVSTTSVNDAKAVQTYAVDHVIDMVKSGKLGLQTAATAVRLVHDKTEQATWTESDIRRIGLAAKKRSDERLEVKAVVRPAKAPYRNPHYIARNHLHSLMAPLTDEEAGRPPPELLDQQHPDRPPGWTYGLDHVDKHGRVQVIPLKEKARLALLTRFNDIAVAICRLAEELPDPAGISDLGQRDADKVRNMLNRNLAKAEANFADFAERFRTTDARKQIARETDHGEMADPHDHR
jgi:hypothetical protein